MPVLTSKLNIDKVCLDGARATLLMLGIVSVLLVVCSGAQADVLRGEVNKSDELLRLTRPGTSGPADDSLRLERAVPVAPQRMQGNLIDNSLFGGAQKDDGRMGLASPGQFAPLPPNKFDLGADRGSRELVLAWERWHHQLSQAIYSRWSEYCHTPGTATLKITVTRDRSIQAVMVHSSGNPEFDGGLLQAILSLNGNPGLTFPSQSQRQAVSLESDYIAGRNVNPGFSWVRNDYEKIHESY
jgi:hypothetical protein